MSTDLLVIVDDNSGAFSYQTYATFPWVETEAPQWYRTTSHIAQDLRGCSLTFTFNGTSAAFIGISLISNTPAATVQIDNITEPFTPSHNYYYGQWFTTPTLPDGRHTINITEIPYPASVDYAIVKVGTQTSLTGQTIIVDDDSSLIQYSGQWSRNTTMFIPGSINPVQAGYPYGNVTHRSSNPGDTFTFRFSGKSIAIYGIFSWYNLGSLAATYSVDGTPYPASISVNTSSLPYLNGTGEVTNHLYFSLYNLSSGPHTLLVNITEAKNHTFILDYITFEPAFDTLASMPSLSSNNSDTGSSASVSRQSVSNGVLVGGVLGGIAFGVLVTILVLLLVLRRRRARKEHYAHPDAALRQGSDLNDPNILNPYATNSFQTQGHQPSL